MKKPEERRQWNNLDTDCLVEIMSRVGIETLVFTIPKLCSKSWYNASLDTTLYRNLNFPELYKYGSTPNPMIFDFVLNHGNAALPELIKFVVDRSKGSSATLQLPSYCDEHAFEYIMTSNKCAVLKSLSLPYNLLHNHGDIVTKLIPNLSELEVLTVKDGHVLQDILMLIKVWCKNFVWLICSSFKFGDEEVRAIIEAMPGIKKLSIEYCWLPRETIARIAKECKELEVFDVTKTLIF